MASDWLDLDVGMRELVFQRLNIYAIVARPTYSWPTSIASSSAVTAVPVNLLLPPGVQPVQQEQRQNQQHQGQWGN